MHEYIAFWKMYERAYETYEHTLFWYAHEHAHICTKIQYAHEHAHICTKIQYAHEHAHAYIYVPKSSNILMVILMRIRILVYTMVLMSILDLYRYLITTLIYVPKSSNILMSILMRILDFRVIDGAHEHTGF
jgi:hypothetical protein